MHLIAIQHAAQQVRSDAKVIRVHACYRNNPHLHIVWIHSIKEQGRKEDYDNIVWTFNVQSGELGHGSYDQSHDEAVAEFERRVALYDHE